MASAIAEYPNTRAPESEKESSQFTYRARVSASTLPERYRIVVRAMLSTNRFGTELWMSTESICVEIGQVYCRRKTAETDTRGRRLGNCRRISRRAVQRLIDDLTYCSECGKCTRDHGSDHAFSPRVEGGGVLDEVYEANSHVPYAGGKAFRHTRTYRLNPEKLVPRETREQYAEERDRARAINRQGHRQEVQRERAEVKQASANQAPANQAQAQPTQIRMPAQTAPSPPVPSASPPGRIVVTTEITTRISTAAKRVMDMCGLPDIGTTASNVGASILAESRRQSVEIEAAAKYLADCILRDQRNRTSINHFYFQHTKWRDGNAGQQQTAAQGRAERSKRSIFEALAKSNRSPGPFDDPKLEE
jgi:hypothetical protein